MEINSKEGKILIVDDSVNNIELLSDILCDDYEVLFATNGDKALKMIPKLLPDLILLDIVMPKMDGYEMIQFLKHNPQITHIPVIFISAKSGTEDMVKGFSLGAVDYISKPFAPEEVKVRVKTHIENQLLLKALRMANHQLQQLSRADGLTGISNRRHFDEFLQQMCNRAKRHGHPISLCLIDIDYFKLYNDHYGHQQGDVCLVEVAQTIHHFTQRDGELAARYGGEEFAIILTESTAQQAREHAEKCLHAVQSLKIEHVQSTCSPHVSISMGLVTIANSVEMTPQNLIQRADSALYQAKQSGRNQIKIN